MPRDAQPNDLRPRFGPVVRRSGLVAMAGLSVALGSGCRMSQESGGDEAAPSPDATMSAATPAAEPMLDVNDPAQAMIAQMIQLSQPGEAHQELIPLMGDFDATLYELGAPGSVPQVSQMTAASRFVLGGRVLMTHWSGGWRIAGRTIPFEGLQIMTWDPVQQQYVSAWLDTLSPGISTQVGTMESGDLVTEDVEPNVMSGMIGRQVTRTLSPDAFVVEFYTPSPETGEMQMTGWIQAARRGSSS